MIRGNHHNALMQNLDPPSSQWQVWFYLEVPNSHETIQHHQELNLEGWNQAEDTCDHNKQELSQEKYYEVKYSVFTLGINIDIKVTDDLLDPSSMESVSVD